MKIKRLISACGVVIGFLFPLFTYAQAGKALTDVDIQRERLTENEMFFGYQTSVTGWVIKAGDTLQMGRGSLPNKAFAFVYANPGALNTQFNNGQLVKQYLPTQYSGRRLEVKRLGQIGGRKIGFTLVAIVGAGLTVRHYVEVESAIESGEILPPIKYRPSAQASPAVPVTVADELIKLKSLLDAGAITKEEYDGQKKKLLNN